MVKSCIYCKTALEDNFVVDVCTRCGIGVWGEKMFAAIVDNMNDARTKGDLYQGSVTDHAMSPKTKPSQNNNALKSIATEAIKTQETNPFERQFNPESKPTRDDVPSLVPETQLTTDSFQTGTGESLGPESESSFPTQEEKQSASALIGSTF
jgi:uncharacterized UBP type Zn finger protein